MKKYYVLYNSIANNGYGDKSAKRIEKFLPSCDIEYIDIFEIDDLEIFINKTNDGRIVLCGGDGTLNRFANSIDCNLLEKDIYYFASGSGNDFDADVKTGKAPYKINEYLKNLPTVEVNATKRKFINGIGYGLDGMACEIANVIRKEKPNKKINYTNIVAKAFLFKYKTVNSIVTVDGKQYKYSNIWINPTMNGRYYGGGMMIAPNQDRLNPDNKVSVVAFHCPSKLKTALVFPSVFKGQHIKHKDMVSIHTGHNITVEFDRPMALQIDGEVILNVTKYTVQTN
jgi:diacylglycerol kinase family enzyme